MTHQHVIPDLIGLGPPQTQQLGTTSKTGGLALIQEANSNSGHVSEEIACNMYFNVHPIILFALRWAWVALKGLWLAAAISTCRSPRPPKL